LAVLKIQFERGKQMYEGTKNQMKRNMYVKLLGQIVTATLAGGAFYLDEKKANELGAADPSLILINATMKNEKGELAVRATDAGVAAVKNAVPAAPKGDTPKLEFKIETGVAIPASAQRGARAGTETYPFSQLGEPTKDANGNDAFASFFIPATEAKPEPAKQLASTVSAASRRYAVKQKDEATGKEKVVGYNRKFIIRPVEGGARVWRTK
jgi:hypothetical protein